jgi:hypothetical protein
MTTTAREPAGQPPLPLRIHVPTYNARRHPEAVADGRMQEHGAPYVPISIRHEAGLRIVLGGADGAQDAPDLVLERQPGGWMLCVTPVGGADHSCVLYILDDGRTFLDRALGDFPPRLRILESQEPVPLLDPPS